jgi:hypothetical protein
LKGAKKVDGTSPDRSQGLIGRAAAG